MDNLRSAQYIIASVLITLTYNIETKELVALFLWKHDIENLAVNICCNGSWFFMESSDNTTSAGYRINDVEEQDEIILCVILNFDLDNQKKSLETVHVP